MRSRPVADDHGGDNAISMVIRHAKTNDWGGFDLAELPGALILRSAVVSDW